MTAGVRASDVAEALHVRDRRAGTMGMRPSAGGLILLTTMIMSSSGSALAASGSQAMRNGKPGGTAALMATLELQPNIETMGVLVSGADLPASAQLSYRASGEATWHAGHPLLRIRDGRLAGSLFGLSPSTSYDILVSDGAGEIEGSAATQPNALSFMPSAILYVDATAAPGGDGSPEAPFSLIQDALNRAGAGTRILVADGVYHEALIFPASGSPGQWIQVKAQGAGAILDGATRVQGAAWIPDSSTARTWFTSVSTPISYLGRDERRFYEYDDLTHLRRALGHDGKAMAEGWYYEPRTARLYVRSLDAPAGHMWQIPTLDHAFDVFARDWIWIEGLEIRFYGAVRSGCGVCAQDASHLVIRSNRIHGMQLGVFVNWTGGARTADDTRIESNEIYDPSAGTWAWSDIKGSSMEGTGIVLRGHRGAIVRDNDIHDLFNGIYAGSSAASANPETALDADIYGNHIRGIGDDALEPEGASINNRFRNNTVEASYVGISLAPITVGPTWVLRSTFSGFSARGIKWDSQSDGIVMVYHNTFWSTAPGASGMDLISPIRNVLMRNNIVASAGYGFAEGGRGSAGIDWNNDNWYSTRPGPHFKWEGADINGAAQVCAIAGLECSGYEAPPGLADPRRELLTLNADSVNIDRGVVVTGVSDSYTGNAPDVGAYEFGCGYPPAVLSDTVGATDAGTGIVTFNVLFSVPVTGVDTSDLAIAATDDAGMGVLGVSGSGQSYSVAVSAPADGRVFRLDVVDDDSIRDLCGNPLGGTGAANGIFFGAESYAVAP